jgi:hypothetical protein
MDSNTHSLQMINTDSIYFSIFECFIYVLPYSTLFDLIAALSVISPVHNIITITPIMTQNMLVPSTVSETKKMNVLLVHASCVVIFVLQRFF